MASVRQAILWLNEGKKVRRAVWGNHIYMYLHDNMIKCYMGNVEFTDGSDWEIYSDKFQEFSHDLSEIRAMPTFIFEERVKYLYNKWIKK